MAVTSFSTLKSKKKNVASVYCTHTDACVLCLQHSSECDLGLCVCLSVICSVVCSMHACISEFQALCWLDGWRRGNAGPQVLLCPSHFGQNQNHRAADAPKACNRAIRKYFVKKNFINSDVQYRDVILIQRLRSVVIL